MAATLRAIVTLENGSAVPVEYPADAPDRDAAAIAEAARVKGVPGFPFPQSPPKVRHLAEGESPPAVFDGPSVRVRVSLTPADDAAPVASVWARAREAGDRVEVRLEHAHADLTPAAGWSVRGRGLDLVVERAEPGVLVCRHGGDS